jgi:hypothetical protein
MAQEQKSGPGAAAKMWPDGAAPEQAGRPPLPVLPPAIPPSAAGSAQTPPPISDTLAFLNNPSAGPNVGSPAAASQHKLPPPLPNMARNEVVIEPPALDKAAELQSVEAPQRRMARRRAAGPPRGKIAANDDAPSIGGLIYALEQKPSSAPFKYAAIATVVWTLVCIGFGWAILSAELDNGITLAGLLQKPTTFLMSTAVIVPIAVLWSLAVLAWRSEELRLRSSTMTEVAIRLAEPDRMAEQSVASLGQAVRRQVAFMNDAISRALGRAGELEALVHNEVTALERSYEENERKIKGLIQELAGERNSLLNTSERVTESLKTLGTDIPSLIDKLSNQQIKLAQIIQGAGDNLASLESAVGQSTDRLEYALGSKTEQLQTMLEGYTSGLAVALGARTDQLQDAIAAYVNTLDASLSSRTEHLQSVFEEYARALDTSLTNRAQALDIQLVERTKALDTAFGQRLKNFDEQIVRSTMQIDSAVAEKARALTSALDNHARTFSETIARQAVNLDESLMHGIHSVRRTSENITRQSLKAIEGLAGQSDMLKRVSENLLSQVNAVTNRFEGQGQAIMRAANSLENANFKLENTLQGRHAELSSTMDKLSGKADEFGRFVAGFQSSMEGSLSDAEARARAAAEQLRTSAESAKQSALADLERFRLEAGAEGERALDELRSRFASISNVVTEQLSSLTSRIDQTSDDVRQRASRAAADIAAEQARLQEQMDRLPAATRESAEAMRHALQDQLRAIEQLSNLTSRSMASRDVSPPSGGGSLTGAYVAEARSLSSLGPAVANEMSQRAAPANRQPPYQQAALPRPMQPASGAGDGREGWSLGDLLARASRDDEGVGMGGGHPSQQPQMPPQPPSSAAPMPFHSQIDVIARALDPATTSALWQRINSGQRGVMARSIYTPEGRAVFDDLNMRYRTDGDLQRTINHYLADFENIRRDAEQRDPSGRASSAHLMSDMGRVYLFLAHVSGRIV